MVPSWYHYGTIWYHFKQFKSVFGHNLAQNWPFLDLMRRIGPVFYEDHHHDLRFRPKCYIFWQKIVFLLQKNHLKKDNRAADRCDPPDAVAPPSTALLQRSGCCRWDLQQPILCNRAFDGGATASRGSHRPAARLSFFRSSACDKEKRMFLEFFGIKNCFLSKKYV